MKAKHIALIIGVIVLADQALKFYIKTNFALNESRNLIGNWAQLYFVENPGMAYGWKFGGNWGKLALTIFRLIAVIFGTFYLGNIIKQKYHTGFIVCASLIYAGALGNLIDSAIYGIIFDKGMIVDVFSKEYIGYDGLAKLAKNGYSNFLHGNVVDMLYFPIIKGNFPSWMPFWKGEYFEFFRPIFNLADASISTGVISILIFQKKFFRQRIQLENNHTIITKAEVTDQTEIF